MDAQAIQLVNKRVSDLADDQTVAEAALFFETGKASLSDADKQALSKLAQDAALVQNYMIEVAGYASSTGTKGLNQKLSDERATAVTDYLRNTANVPMRPRRIRCQSSSSKQSGCRGTRRQSTSGCQGAR